MRLENFYDLFYDSIGLISGISVFVMSLCIFWEVFSRYILHSPTIWAEEIAIYLLIASAFLGSAYTLKENKHVRVDFFINKASGFTKLILEILGIAMCTIYSAAAAYTFLIFTVEAYVSGETSPTLLHVPMWIIYGVIVLSFLLMLPPLICDLYRALSHKRAAVALTVALLLLAHLLAAILSNNQQLLIVFMFASLIAVLLTGTPVAYAIGFLGTMLIYLTLGSSAMSIIPSSLYKALDSITLTAVPLFILTSLIIGRSGMSSLIYEFAASWLNRVPGGLGVASVIACAIFGAISGSSVATTTAIGVIAIPEMIKRGYDKRLTYGVIASSGFLGILIPPSIGMIIYGEITGVSVGKLFIAGVFPGLLITAVLSAYVIFASRKRDERRYTWKERLHITYRAAPLLVIPVLILGGIYAGVFTPTESAGVAAVYSIILALIYRWVDSKSFLSILRESAETSSFILFILASSTLYSTIVASFQVPQKVINTVFSANLHPWIVLLLLILTLLALGTVLEAVSIVVITLPVIYPLITALGFDPIWFAVIMTVVLGMGLLTPPVGMNLFVVKGITGAPIDEIVRGCLPFLVLLALSLAILCLVPQLCTWLPSKMFGY